MRETHEAENVVDDTGDNKKRTNENDKEQPVAKKTKVNNISVRIFPNIVRSTTSLSF